ncbi:MAG TPA: MBL fold metallo-hydrolase [Steroidobacteraceae bacterium]|nr:MBL fold metallo-hydrolase [Steroidobacteraceae bacterium]
MITRIHHLNCISSCPLGGRLMDGRTPGVLTRGSLCCHCLLIETGHSLVLVDTGFGTRDVRDPRSRLSGFFLTLLSPDFREELTAIRQIERLGFDPHDVRHIVLTHLDFDHAGGLDDFPWARVHMMRQERDDAVARRSWLDQQRYRPQQWSDRSKWQVHDGVTGNHWLGFDQVCGGSGLPDELLMVPMSGHTLGHAAIAIQKANGWLLQAGDAYFHHREMDVRAPWCTPGLRAYQWLMEKDRVARLANQVRLRELRAAHSEVDICCAHDPVEFQRLAHRPMSEPAPPLPPAERYEISDSGVYVRPSAEDLARRGDGDARGSRRPH